MTTIRRTSSRLFRCVVFVCLRIRASLLASASSEAPLCPIVRFCLSMETLLDPGRRFVQESLYGRVGLHRDQALPRILSSIKQITVNSSPRLPRVSKHSTSLPWETAKPQDKACSWERIEAPLPPLRPRPKCDFIHPRQLSPFPERLVLPISNEVILSGYEELDSSGNDLFTSWAKLSVREILVQHMVDIEKATAEFREASERKTCYLFSLRLCRRDPGPRREKKMPSNNKLQEGGRSLPCRRRPNL